MQIRRIEPAELDPSGFRSQRGLALAAIADDGERLGAIAARVEGAVATIFEKWVSGGPDVLALLLTDLLSGLQHEFDIGELRAGANNDSLYNFYVDQIGMRLWTEVVRYQRPAMMPTPNRRGIAAIRKFRPDDESAIADLVRSSEGSKRLIRLAQEHESHFVVAEIAGQVVGYGLSYVDGSYCLLKSIIVDPSVRRCGVGWDLTLDAIRWADGLGLPVCLNTEADNVAARRLYEGLGYHVTDHVRLVHRLLR